MRTQEVVAVSLLAGLMVGGFAVLQRNAGDRTTEKPVVVTPASPPPRTKSVPIEREAPAVDPQTLREGMNFMQAKIDAVAQDEENRQRRAKREAHEREVRREMRKLREGELTWDDPRAA